jgi:hypothetical protein
MADANFLSQLETLLGLNPEKAKTQVDELEMDDLLGLVDAVNKQDQDAAVEILKVNDNAEGDVTDEDEEDDVNSLFTSPSDEDEDEDGLHYSEDEDYDPSVGDIVVVKTSSGKPMKGTVKYASGPSDTVGVMIKGKLKMIKRDKVKSLKENFGGVMGMTDMVSLKRMQALAGLRTQPEAEVVSPVTVTQIEPIAPESAPEAVAPLLSACEINAVLDQVERSMCDMRVADLRGFRERLSRIMCKLNEDFRR